jgi:hypothetical protein
MAMTVEIKGNKLCIEIDLEKPTPSASGKTLVVASNRGYEQQVSRPALCLNYVPSRWSFFAA